MDEADKSSLIQQRIKKMMENKKKHADLEHTKRLKSGTGTTGDKVHEAETEEELGKPASSKRLRRPVSAFKATESTHGVNVPQAQKVEINVKSLLLTVFDHGTKLQQFLRENRLDPGKYHDYLSGNQLFLLSVLSKLSMVPQQKHSAAVEKLTIGKITRDLSVRAQLQRCEQAEQRITERLEERLRVLSKKG